MKLSKSKPNLRSKKIISLNINKLKNPNINYPKDNDIIDIEKNPQNNKNAENMINNNNLEVSDLTQSDWVTSAIQVKTRNNGIIKLSLENDNVLEKTKTKESKLQKYKDLDFKSKEENNEYNLNEIMNDKESVYMIISTKDSEKFEKNIQYLSNRKNNNDKIKFPENFNDIKNENNIDEDFVNLKTLTLINANTDINNGNKLYNKNKINKKIIKKEFFNSKFNTKKPIRSKMLDSRNKRNCLQKEIFNTNEVNKESRNNKDTNIKKNSKILLIDLYNKNLIQKNISFSNLYKNSGFLYNNNLNLTNKNCSLTNISNQSKLINKKNLQINISGLKTKNFITEKTEEKIMNPIFTKKNDNNFIAQSYKYITPNKNLLKDNYKYYPPSSSKFIKKNISYKFLLSSYNKSNILLRNFLTQINLQKYFSILKKNGFDNINFLIEQMKTNNPLKDAELKSIGISIPGDRAKILIRLEEKANLFPFHIPKKVYYSLDNNADINEKYIINNDEKIIELKRWLKEFKLENYINNFIKNGYYTVELFLFQMISKNPINNDILQFEIGIDKIGHRSRILSILKEESKNLKEKIENKEPISFIDETKNCECSIF